jgi:hypothetical protein
MSKKNYGIRVGFAKVTHLLELRRDILFLSRTNYYDAEVAVKPAGGFLLIIKVEEQLRPGFPPYIATVMDESGALWRYETWLGAGGKNTLFGLEML